MARAWNGRGLNPEALERLIRTYEDLLKTIPTAKKQILYAAAVAAKRVLDEQISQRVDDSRGRVRRWQEVSMGSRGGYSAVSPTNVQVQSQNGKSYGYNSAQITGFLERGHAAPLPRGRSTTYRERVKTTTIRNDHAKTRSQYVIPGRQFYSWTRDHYAPQVALDAMYDKAEELVEDWEDLLAELD